MFLVGNTSQLEFRNLDFFIPCRSLSRKCYRLGTLTYTLSFELGVKVTAWRERNLRAP